MLLIAPGAEGAQSNFVVMQMTLTIKTKKKKKKIWFAFIKSMTICQVPIL